MSVFVVCDRVQPVEGQLNLTLLDFEGSKLWSEQNAIKIPALSSKAYFSAPTNMLLAGRDAKNVFLVAELLVGGKPVSRNEYFFQPFKNLALPRPQINTSVLPVRGGFKITLSAEKFARAVYLSLPNYQGFFEDNYFDLMPGEKV